jgi:hypothetical protein
MQLLSHEHKRNGPTTGNLIQCRWGCFCFGIQFEFRIWKFLIHLNVNVPFDPVILLLDIYSKEMKMLLKGNENICSNKDWHINIYSSFIHHR